MLHENRDFVSDRLLDAIAEADLLLLLGTGHYFFRNWYTTAVHEQASISWKLVFLRSYDTHLLDMSFAAGSSNVLRGTEIQLPLPNINTQPLCQPHIATADVVFWF